MMRNVLAHTVRLQMKRCFRTSSQSDARVAMVLSGCGVYDGSELHEASACWTALSRAGAEVAMFAPNTTQMHVIDHTKGEVMQQERNTLTESARIARGDITALAQLCADQYDAIVFPGGFGAAKNLSNFATEGANMTCLPDVERVLKEFHAARKPIGLCCIAPVLAARVLPGVSLTVGSDDETNPRWPHAGAAAACRQMGATHVNTDIDQVHVDEEQRVVTSAAFMCNTAVHEVVDNVGLMIHALLRLLHK